jgi:hypothetical protein
MEREELIQEVKKYFKLEELVSEAVHNKYGETAWFIFQTELLACLLLVRVGIGKPITINTWANGGRFDERGYRENLSDIVQTKTNNGQVYLSGHVLGMAVDFTVKGMTATKVREWIVDNQEMFPCKIRLERSVNGKEISWVHLDTKYYDGNGKIYLFDI